MPPTISMSQEELLALPATMRIETAARAFGIGRTKARDLHRRGEFPCKVLRLGRKLVVTRTHLFEALGIADQPVTEAPKSLQPEPPRSTRRPSSPPTPRETQFTSREVPLSTGYVVVALPVSDSGLADVLAALTGSAGLA